MITPGAAGATIMFLVNGLAYPFPELPQRWVALGLSFLVGIMVFSAPELKRSIRAVFYVLNSLLIFVVSFGVANLGHQATSEVPSAQARISSPDKLDALAVLFPSAYAQPRNDGGTQLHPLPPQPAPTTSDTVQQLERKVEDLRRENEQLKKQQSQTTQTTKDRFFKKW